MNKYFLQFFLVITLLSIPLKFYNFNSPFIHYYGGAATIYGNIARNFVRYGFLFSKFGPMENTGEIK